MTETINLPCGCEIEIFYDYVDDCVGGDVINTCDYDALKARVEELEEAIRDICNHLKTGRRSTA